MERGMTALLLDALLVSDCNRRAREEEDRQGSCQGGRLGPSGRRVRRSCLMNPKCGLQRDFCILEGLSVSWDSRLGTVSQHCTLLRK
ncbi:hypothetical protein NDU88_008403 [Pleurodeles waltl]|uniref:Secreted protein n=1 Tax=Pleurodeles waltl TaxID=8319 RepID=A0AAV7QSF0_PLEWA|nr:hypothetical protein NDU88_008403 [Pleurodeles waltl]